MLISVFNNILIACFYQARRKGRQEIFYYFHYNALIFNQKYENAL